MEEENNTGAESWRRPSVSRTLWTTVKTGGARKNPPNPNPGGVAAHTNTRRFTQKPSRDTKESSKKIYNGPSRGSGKRIVV